MSVDINRFIVDGSYKCSEIIPDWEQDAFRVIDKLILDPTVEKLNRLLIEFPDYKLNNGARCNWTDSYF